jgi:hypothetical protein
LHNGQKRHRELFLFQVAFIPGLREAEVHKSEMASSPNDGSAQ